MSSETPYRTVWAVSDGEYSDYRVRCLFEREVDADAAVLAGVGGYTEEFRLYGPGVAPRVWQTWNAHATVGTSPDGDSPPSVAESWQRVSEVTADDVDRRPCAPGERRMPDGTLYLSAHGCDREAVIKSVSDRYAKARAERDGL